MFPRYSEEAKKHLGLPDSPVLHLAVTDLADRLMPFAASSSLEPRLIRIGALRTASRSILEMWPFEQAVFAYLAYVDPPGDEEAAEAAMRTTRTDWLALAEAKIRAGGLQPGQEASRMATPYGWDAQRAGTTPSARWTLTDAERTVTDEHGREWIIPGDRAAWHDLLNSYGQALGHRPSDVVMYTFYRHPGAWRTLWMLVTRCVEGERLNLAARALALGPIPPLRTPPTPSTSGVAPTEEQLRKRWKANDERDRQAVIQLQAEAEDFRNLGYAD